MPHHHAVTARIGQVDLPHPSRAALPYEVLALVSLALCLTPVWPVGLVAASAFAGAAAVSAWREQQTLDRLRASVDATLLRRTRMPFSPLVLWRTGEVTGHEFRERVAAELRRMVHAARPEALPGASPIDRAAVHRNTDELLALAARLESPKALDARCVLLARRLAHDPTSPFYDAFAGDTADRAVDEVTRAFHLAHRPGRSG